MRRFLACPERGLRCAQVTVTVLGLYYSRTMKRDRHRHRLLKDTAGFLSFVTSRMSFCRKLGFRAASTYPLVD
jgi:hypothetical protein